MSELRRQRSPVRLMMSNPIFFFGGLQIVTEEERQDEIQGKVGKKNPTHVHMLRSCSVLQKNTHDSARGRVDTDKWVTIGTKYEGLTGSQGMVHVAGIRDASGVLT